MANDTDDEFSGFSSDDFSEFFNELQESSSISEVPGFQEHPPLREETGEDDDGDGELNELAGTGAGTVARLNPEIRGMNGMLSCAGPCRWESWKSLLTGTRGPDRASISYRAGK